MTFCTIFGFLGLTEGRGGVVCFEKFVSNGWRLFAAFGGSEFVGHFSAQHKTVRFRSGLCGAFVPYIWRFLTTGWVVLLASMFFAAAFSKIFDPAGMQRSLQWYGEQVGLAHGVVFTFSRTVFYGVVLSEILLGAALLSGHYTKVSLIGASALLGVFVIWLLHARLLGMDAPCGCGVPVMFGEGTGGAITRNVLLIGGSLLAVYIGGSTLQASPQHSFRVNDDQNPHGAGSALRERNVKS